MNLNIQGVLKKTQILKHDQKESTPHLKFKKTKLITFQEVLYVE